MTIRRHLQSCRKLRKESEFHGLSSKIEALFVYPPPSAFRLPAACFAP